MSKRCPSCGHENRDVAIYCGNCGYKLISSSFTSNFRDAGTSSNGSGATVKPKVNSGSNDAGSVCCAVLIVLFIIILIMSMG